jgi:hypothetical protein
LTALPRELMTARGVPIDESLNSGSVGCAKPAAAKKRKG